MVKIINYKDFKSKDDFLEQIRLHTSTRRNKPTRGSKMQFIANLLFALTLTIIAPFILLLMCLAHLAEPVDYPCKKDRI